MRDFVLDSQNQDRYTYFFAFYGRDYQYKTALLHVEHDFCASIKELHRLIRNRINEILGEETPSCYHIIALASPEPIPCGVSD
jgi:hypothetical protein